MPPRERHGDGVRRTTAWAVHDLLDEEAPPEKEPMCSLFGVGGPYWSCEGSAFRRRKVARPHGIDRSVDSVAILFSEDRPVSVSIVDCEVSQ